MSRRAPGPRGHPLVGSLPELRRDPLGFYAALASEHGDVVRFRAGLPHVGAVRHLLVRPDHVHHVLVARAARYRKFVIYHRLRLRGGNGMLTSEGERWHRQRSAARPAFTRERIDALVPVFVSGAAALAGSWERAADEGGTVDVAVDMARLAFGNLVRALAGCNVADESADLVRAVDCMIVHFKSATYNALALPLPRSLGEGWRTLKALTTLRGFARRLIAARRAGDRSEDLLTLLLQSRDERTHQPLDDDALTVELMTFLLAGFETTAVALTWSLYLLARSPAIADDLAAVPTSARLRAVVLEAMRLYPPSWSVDRRAVVDDVIDGFHVPAGSVVLLSPFLTQRSPRWWPDPLRFDPTRFESGSSPTPNAYFPFGAGERRCIGSHLALVHAEQVLATLLPRFVLHAKGEPELEPVVSLRPRGGLPMRIERRTERT